MIIRREISTSIVWRNTVAALLLEKTVSRKDFLQDRGWQADQPSVHLGSWRWVAWL